MLVLTNRGEMVTLRAPRPWPQVGQEIPLPAGLVIPVSWRTVAAAMVLLLMASTITATLLTPPVWAVVAMDINPSLELYVGPDRQVVKVKSLNPEAEALARDLPLRRRQIYEAVALLVDRAAQLGYVGPDRDNTILTAVIVLEPRQAGLVDRQKLENTIREELQKHRAPGTVRVGSASEELAEQARTTGLSVNRMRVLQKAQEQGINLQPEQLKGGGLREELKKAGIDPDGLLEHLDEDEPVKKGRNQDKEDGKELKRAEDEEDDDDDNEPEDRERERQSEVEHEPDEELRAATPPKNRPSTD